MHLQAAQELYGKRFIKYGNIRFIDNGFHVSTGHKYLYCDIPKAGCTTIKKTLIESVEKVAVDFNVHDRKRNPLLRPSQAFASLDELEGFFKFLFVRNPFTRVLSGYLDKIKGNKIEKRGIVRMLGMDYDNFAAVDVSFIQFLGAIASADLRLVDTHFKPQTLLSCYYDIAYDFVGKFEEFDSDLVAVLERISGEAVSRNAIRSIRHHKTDASKLCAQYYDNEAEQLVKDIYGEDFRLFGYEDVLP
jgi:hypothetical protein